MQFERIAAVSGIPPGGMRRVQRDAGAVLVANVAGVIYAISDTCSHRGGTLSAGTIEDGIVTCPRHGARFDVTTGKNVGGPKLLFLRPAVGDVRSYPVEVDGDAILLGVE